MTATIYALRLPEPVFDPDVWLAAWGDAGGLAALIGDRLMLGRLQAIDGASHWRLDALRRSVMLPANASAVHAVLAARSLMEADHG